jgi:conjugal transfer pilus assembly protein TraW
VNSDFFVFFVFVITGLLAPACIGEAQAEVTKNLGTMGMTYPVIEPDIVVQLKERAIHKSNEEQRRLLAHIEKYQPANIHSLPRATAGRSFPVDMTYTLEHDLRDGEGKIIYPRGFTFNPLDYVPFSEGLVIIDGDDPEQVAWFIHSPYARNHRARLLITGGYAHELSRELQRAVYYLTDVMAKRLQLAAVPAVVVREGSGLRVREIVFSSPAGGQHEER